MTGPVDVIDLFAGPGGLGEGFSAFRDGEVFRIAMSVEMDPKAHSTLTHRAFFRKLPPEGKQAFADFIKCTDTARRAEILDEIKVRFSRNWGDACAETLEKPRALGDIAHWQKLASGANDTGYRRKLTEDEKTIYSRIREIRAANRPLVVIGGPPCQAYSNSGRSRNKGKHDYSPDRDHRFFLFEEYRKVIAEAQPDFFVMENVEGILSAKMDDGKLIFPRILETLKRPGRAAGTTLDAQYDIYSFVAPPDGVDKSGSPFYLNPKTFTIKANTYGIPQTRHRVILLGANRRHGPIKSFWGPDDFEQAPTVSDMIGTMPRIRSGSSDLKRHEDTLQRWVADHEGIRRSLLANLRDAADPALLRELANSGVPTGYFLGDGRGSNLFVPSSANGFSKEFSSRRDLHSKELRKWVRGQVPNAGFANHKAKGHMASDRARYMFSAAWAAASPDSESPSPKSRDFPAFLAPNHRNWQSGTHADRFRCMAATMVAKTITSHLNRDGHAYIHYDTRQNRSLTVREAARIQTFPDDYLFEGSAKDQYQQVGNAVPPFLALRIARHLHAIMRNIKLL